MCWKALKDTDLELPSNYHLFECVDCGYIVVSPSKPTIECWECHTAEEIE